MNRYVGAIHEASQLACLFIGIDWNRTRKSYNRATRDLGMDMVPGHSAQNNHTNTGLYAKPWPRRTKCLRAKLDLERETGTTC